MEAHVPQNTDADVLHAAVIQLFVHAMKMFADRERLFPDRVETLAIL